MIEIALVKRLNVLASAGQPGADGRLPVAEDPFGGGCVQSFGQRREHHRDLMGRGFQTVQGRVPSSTERGVTGRASKGLDALGLAMLAITDKRVDMGLSDSKVQALSVGTGKALSVDALGCSSAAFDLAPGAYRSRYWPCTRGGSGGETTGGAVIWAAGLQHTGKPAVHRGLCSRLGRTSMGPTQGTKQREGEQEEEHR